MGYGDNIEGGMDLMKGSFTLRIHSLTDKIRLYDFPGIEEAEGDNTATFWTKFKPHYSKLHLLDGQFEKFKKYDRIPNIDPSEIKEEDSVDINNQIHAYIYFMGYTKDNDKLAFSMQSLQDLKKEVETVDFSPIIVIPKLDLFIQESSEITELLKKDDITKSEIYWEFIKKFNSGTTNSLFGLINPVAGCLVGTNNYPACLQALSLEVLLVAINQAKRRIIDRGLCKQSG